MISELELIRSRYEWACMKFRLLDERWDHVDRYV